MQILIHVSAWQTPAKSVQSLFFLASDDSNFMTASEVAAERRTGSDLSVSLSTVANYMLFHMKLIRSGSSKRASIKRDKIRFIP